MSKGISGLKKIIIAHYGSQANFAKRLNISPATLSLALNGQYKKDLTDQIIKVLEEDGIHIAEEDFGDARDIIENSISALKLLLEKLNPQDKSYLEFIIASLTKALRRLD